MSHAVLSNYHVALVLRSRIPHAQIDIQLERQTRLTIHVYHIALDNRARVDIALSLISPTRSWCMALDIDIASISCLALALPAR